MSNPNVDERVSSMNIENFNFTQYPVRFWDVYGEKGIPVRTTISDMGPDLLGRILNLSDVQISVLQMIFKIADDHGLLLIDTKDLRAMLQHVADEKEEFQIAYGTVAVQTLGAISRAILNLETSGGDTFFGEPGLNIMDWFALNYDGRGMINLMSSSKLVQSPILYSTFLLWMLSEMYETLPEVGDLEKPKMVFFFDEAHLLFNNAPKALLDKVELVVRLIRSKGVGIYFITQQPDDIPNTVLSQLGHKIQHALRAYTPKDQKAVKAAAASFRVNPNFDTETVLGELGTGEALISVLDESGTPTIVERARVLPPQSSFATIEDEYIQGLVRGDGYDAKYRVAVDNISAYEVIQEKRETALAEAEAARLAAEEAKCLEQEAKEEAKRLAEEEKRLAKEEQLRLKEEEREYARKQREAERSKQRLDRAIDRVVMNTLSSVGRNVGNTIMRGIFGSRKK